MSLFKVRDFWSLDLDQIATQYSAVRRGNDIPEPRVDSRAGEKSEANFVVALGQFQSIGHYDVFVCADLEGFICIIQVPEVEQEKFTVTSQGEKDNHQSCPTSAFSEDDDSSQRAKEMNDKNNHHHNLLGRQLLAAKQLDYSIVELKCGFFTSALKQSIAVLSFDKIVVYQVKIHQVDLISSSSAMKPNSSVFTLDEDLLSHELEEHYRIDLLAHELASNIVIFDRHADSSLINNSQRVHHPYRTSEHIKQGKEFSYKRVSKQDFQSVQHLHLPQRDIIIVQYANQFVFTIVDHKKIAGHYKICDDAITSSTNTIKAINRDTDSGDADHESHKQELAQYVGPMPMAFLSDSKGISSLVISLSDHRIRCISLAKLMALAKQNVMKRVTQNLLHDKEVSSHCLSNEKPASWVSLLSYDNAKTTVDSEAKIDLDLDSMADWEFELISRPIQMLTIQRQARDNSISPNDHHHHRNHHHHHHHHHDQYQSQLLVMSRYNLDLFSISGHHIWSQRFETPLICIYTYIITSRSDADRIESSGNQQKEIHSNDRMLTLVCTDYLSANKCNLLILDENHIAWSALLNTRPIQLWRTNLSKISGIIAALDISQAHLSISYLGTNLDSSKMEDFGLVEGDKLEKEFSLAQMNLIDDSIFNKDSQADFEDDNLLIENKEQKLSVDIRLKASNNWPNVYVESFISIRPGSVSSEILHNITATIEFDDLISFKSYDFPISILSDGIVQLKLGSFWPNKRELISLNGHFSMQNSSNARITNTSHQIITSFNQQVNIFDSKNILPKSLKVNMYFRFDETHSGSSLQEESFLLPLNMVAKLAHIDYSSGQDQSLDNVQTNLNLYKRHRCTSYTTNKHYDVGNTLESPYYLCDIFIRTKSDMIDMIDEIIESDLICPGLNSESMNNHKLENGKERKINTIDSINLLAQSLDCPLTPFHPTTDQKSEEYPQAVMVSIALKVPNGAHIMSGFEQTGKDEKSQLYAIVWLHLCDLSAINSTIPEEIVKQHMKEWKTYFDVDKVASSTNEVKPFAHPVLVSIECEHPIPVLFIQNHITQRLTKRSTIESNQVQFHLDQLSESIYDSIEINYRDLLKMDNFIAISTNLHDRLKSALEEYEINLKVEFRRLKEELSNEYCKFHISTMTSLSVSKRLFNLPDNVRKQFTNLSSLTKHYQSNLLRLLSELERLKKLDYLYSKISNASDIMIERQNKVLSRWPNFAQIID